MARMLTIEEFARESGVPAVTVRRHVIAGSLPATKHSIKGKKFKYLINEEELNHYTRGAGDVKLAQQVRDLEARIRYLEEFLRVQGAYMVTPRNEPRMTNYVGAASDAIPIVTSRVLTATMQTDHPPEQIGAITVYWHMGLVSKGSCVKIALAHGASENGAKQMQVPDAQRIDIRTVFEYIRSHLNRPAAINRWRNCDAEGCICGRLDDDRSVQTNNHVP